MRMSVAAIKFGPIQAIIKKAGVLLGFNPITSGLANHTVILVWHIL